jgi:acyl-CoA thioesterase FadM
MSRLAIEIPDDFSFSTQLPVLIEHVNYGAHLGNDSYLSIIHEARIRYLESLGVSELVFEKPLGLVLTDSYIGYKQETTRGDILEVFVSLKNLTRLECDFYYKLISIHSGKLIAIAKTGAAFFNFETRKLSPLSKEFISSFQTQCG